MHLQTQAKGWLAQGRALTAAGVRSPWTRYGVFALATLPIADCLPWPWELQQAERFSASRYMHDQGRAKCFPNGSPGTGKTYSAAVRRLSPGC